MFDELADWLKTCDADIVCLQEVTRTAGINGWTRFEDDERSLPQRANLLSDVSSLLPNHLGQFAVSDSGPIHDELGATHRQDFGLATFVRESIPVVRSRSEFVHGDYADHEDHWPTDGRPRIAQATRVFDREAARFVTVTNFHGLRDANGKHDTPMRRVQAERLTALVDAVHATSDVLVVCGDFNVLPDSETFSLLSAIGLVDLVGTADTRTSHYGKTVRHASYLLVSAPKAIKRFEVISEPEVSDHRPLLIEI